VTNHLENTVEEIIYQRALLILSHRDHSVEELRQKLMKRDFPGAAIEAVLSKLRRDRLLDDSMFSKAFVRGRVRNKPMGRMGLVRELLKRGVSEDIVQDAIGKVLDEEEVDEEEIARKLAEKKHRGGVKNIGDMLRRRGFAGDIIRKILEDGNSYR
jgi:regulatory protein